MKHAVVRQVLIAALGGALSVASAQAKARSTGKVDVDKYDETFKKYSKRYFGIGYDWRVFKAQALAESGMDTAAVSWVGARGLMQLMPSTYKDIQSRAPMLHSIDDPEWNIAAGIMHNRGLYKRWKDPRSEDERRYFMFGSYNAGEGPILRAQRAAIQRSLDASAWQSIETVAPEIPRWRYRETLGYVKKIKGSMAAMDDKGRLKPKSAKKTSGAKSER